MDVVVVYSLLLLQMLMGFLCLLLFFGVFFVSDILLMKRGWLVYFKFVVDVYGLFLFLAALCVCLWSVIVTLYGHTHSFMLCMSYNKIIDYLHSKMYFSI